MVPQSVPLASNMVFPAQDPRYSCYQDVIAKMSTNDQDQSKALQLPAGLTPNFSDGWMSEGEGADEPKGHKSVVSDNVRPLLGGFADADTLE